MAINPLSLTESLRPWRTAGLLHFLNDILGESEATLDDSHTVSAPASASNHLSHPDALAQSAMRPGTQPDTRNTSANCQATGPGHSQIGSTRPPVSPSGAAPSTHPSSRTHVQDATDSEQQASGTQLASDPSQSVAEWPDPWRQLIRKTHPAPVIWTYPELGSDLLGMTDPASAQRSAFLRTLIGSLAMPKGTNAFWPFCFAKTADPLDSDTFQAPTPSETSSDNSDQTSISYFQKGLTLLRPTVVILIGESCLGQTRVPLSLSTPFTQQVHQGTLFILLPEFPALIENRSLANQCVIFLRGAFSGINIHNETS